MGGGVKMTEEKELQKMPLDFCLHLIKGDIIVWITDIEYKRNGEEI